MNQNRIFILYALNIKKRTMEKWKELFEICKIQHPNWRKNTINDFIEFEKEWNQTHDFDTFITADKDENVIPIIKHYNPLHLD